MDAQRNSGALLTSLVIPRSKVSHRCVMFSRGSEVLESSFFIAAFCRSRLDTHRLMVSTATGGGAATRRQGKSGQHMTRESEC